MRIRRLSGVVAAVLVASSCGGKDSSGPPPVAGLSVQSGGTQKALAGTSLPGPIVIALRDASGNLVSGQTATFTVISGGGFIANTTGQANPDGTITAPTWTLGKKAIPQLLQATVNGITLAINATVQTDYVIDIQFYGRPLSLTQQQLFTNAAARVRAMLVNGEPPVALSGEDVKFCTGSSTPVTTTVVGVLIFAAIDSIDGPNNTLAQAGPCAFDPSNFRTIYGRMKFDSADVKNANAAELEETITHEMLHVVGFGTYWSGQYKGLLINESAPGTAYIGAGGIAGCRAVGGTVTCANSVPVEDCVGVPNCGAGNRDGHWKESTFGRELMTPFVSTGSNPLSAMTIKSFEDLGYTVNVNAADAYTIAVGSLSSAAAADEFSRPAPPNWERPLGVLLKPIRVPRTVGGN